jgi:predicted tellurium resistance membrane protein TerC
MSIIKHIEKQQQRKAVASGCMMLIIFAIIIVFLIALLLSHGAAIGHLINHVHTVKPATHPAITP